MLYMFCISIPLKRRTAALLYLPGRAPEIFKLSHCDCMYFDFLFLGGSCGIPVVFLKYTIKNYHS